MADFNINESQARHTGANITNRAGALPGASLLDSASYLIINAAIAEHRDGLAVSTATASGTNAAVQRASLEFGVAQGRRAHVFEEYQVRGMAVPAEVIAEEDAAVDTAKRKLDALQASAREANAQSTTARHLTAGLLVLLAAYKRDGIREVADKTVLPRGADPRRVVDERRPLIAAKLVERKQHKAAPLPAEVLISKLVGQRKAEASKVMPGLNLSGKEPSMAWLPRMVHALADGGNVPHVPDSVPLACFVLGEALDAHIRAEVVKRYKSIPLALTVEAKAKALAKIDAEILAAEYLECAAIRVLRASGVEVAYRRDTDLRALAGVVGPKVVFEG